MTKASTLLLCGHSVNVNGIDRLSCVCHCLGVGVEGRVPLSLCLSCAKAITDKVRV
jgi:hypothetical protein